jgi:hypothetical protein
MHWHKQFCRALALVWLPFLLAPMVVTSLSCRSVYYSTLEALGYEKRDILVGRVHDARDEQQEAKETFRTALERLKGLVDLEPTDLEDRYADVSAEYERAYARAEDVRERIRSIEDVGEDLFVEWRNEIHEISNSDLRRRSERIRDQALERYEHMLAAMHRVEGSMEPVLVNFNDQRLFLKHNLNAQVLAELQGNLTEIETDVERLIDDMERAIDAAEDFVKSMESPA